MISPPCVIWKIYPRLGPAGFVWLRWRAPGLWLAPVIPPSLKAWSYIPILPRSWRHAGYWWSSCWPATLIAVWFVTRLTVVNCRKIAADLDIGLPRFRIRKHYYPVEDENPYIIRDMSKCILCRRCVAACQNLKGEKIFSVAYRGFNSKVIYGLDQPVGSKEACRDCDTCISLCPTGALSKPTPNW